ncbi:MAG: ABC-type transport auxiliary lipoprotein family protein [Cycloclasticus sp.]|nr:ABC-type transport auxiliary lipoprotein family protein [Cycloclasticus sp.]
MWLKSTSVFLFIGAISLSVISLVGCSGAPTKTSYYVLDSAQAQATENQPKLNRPLVIIKSIYLADFLKQTGLIMQINQHQLQPARSHLWAESLDKGIKKSLLQDLKFANLDYTVSADYRWLAEQARYEVQINIDQFHVTDHSNVVMSGSYWIIDAQTKKVLVNGDFSYQGELKEDGYEHAVSRLRDLIRQLSQQIGESLKLLSHNNETNLVEHEYLTFVS